MVSLYLDGANVEAMKKHGPSVSGFTTNPSLMRSAGLKDYFWFASEALEAAAGKPVSFEVFADDFPTMGKQARKIASWGENVYVKIPAMNSLGEPTDLVVNQLSMDGVKLNVTAIFTLNQIRTFARSLSPTTPAILSIFAGRIADTGRDPTPLFTDAARVKHDKTKVLWASTREAYNIKQAEMAGADIITVSPDILAKTALFGKDLLQYSLETCRQFSKDAEGLTL